MSEQVKTTRRENYISWDDYFMGVAMLSAKRSKDPSTQVGACIVSPDNKIVGTGYNGFPNGCSDDEFPWSREGGKLESKYAYVVHAELNAILNSSVSVKGCRIYVAMHPCEECAKAIIQSGITEVIYASDKYAETDGVKASKRMLEAAGVISSWYNGDIEIEGATNFKQDSEITYLKQLIQQIRNSVSWSMDPPALRKMVLAMIDDSKALE